MSFLEWLWGPMTNVTELAIASAVSLVLGIVLILVGLFIAYRRVYGRFGVLLSLGMMAIGAMVALGVL